MAQDRAARGTSSTRRTPPRGRSTPKSTSGRRTTARERLQRERIQFKQLLAINPNYFGNLEESPFSPVLEMVGNTAYEELTCLGYNPSLQLLEATIQIKLPFGFSGDLCSGGSTEYVRFYIDYGSGWQDVGLASVNAHDIANINDCAGDPDKPLTYVLTHPLDPETDYCGNPVLPNVRGILSWQAIPPAATPNWPPVWGNVLDRHIQIKPRRWRWWDLLKHIGIEPEKAELPPGFEEMKLEPIPLPDPPPLSLAEVASMYLKPRAGEGVEPHRFGLPYLNALAPQAGIEQLQLSQTISEWQELNIDWESVIGALAEEKANVTYEELDCLGLDYNAERLVATFRIKRPIGYSGDLCTAGSQEYVAFWADWDDTCEWTYLGTVPVNVHDISNIPPDGLHFAAILPVSLDTYRRRCEEPKIGRVRAVLSWAVPPSTTDPDDLTTWGNRLDAHVQIKPGQPVVPGVPYVSILGGIPVGEIEILGTGLTKPWAKFALTGGDADPWVPWRECPFGGLVVVQGPPVLGSRYRVRVRNTATAAEQVVLTPIRTVDFLGFPTWRNPDPDGCFTYLGPLQNMDNLLAWWQTGGNDLWEVRVEIVEPTPGSSVLATTAWHRIQLDNQAPDAEIDIALGQACADFNQGFTVTGTFAAQDLHFGYYDLRVLPASMNPNPTSPSSGTTGTGGLSWSLDTSSPNPMPVCGYVVELRVWDRSIVGSSPGSHNSNSDDVGFCLRAP